MVSWDGIAVVVGVRGWNNCDIGRDYLLLIGYGGPQLLIFGGFRVTCVTVVICFHFPTAIETTKRHLVNEVERFYRGQDSASIIVISPRQVNRRTAGVPRGVNVGKRSNALRS